MLCFSNKTHPPHPKDGPWAWLVLSYCFLNAVVFGGIAFGYGAILPVLMEALHENRERTALVGSLTLGATLFLSVVASKLCERFSCRIVNGTGIISNVVGFTLSSSCTSVYPLYITYSLLNGIGNACVYTANFIILRQYFKKHYSLSVGILTAGAGIGMVAIGPVVQYMTDSFGWKNTFRIFAGVIAANVPLVFVFDPNVESCEDVNPEESTEENNVKREEDVVVKPRKILWGILDLSVWTFPEYTMCVVAIFIGYWGHYTPMIHMIKYSEELGISPTKSSTLLVFVGIATIVSRVICGRLCDVRFIKARYVHQAGVIVSGISTILLTFAVNYTHLIIFSLVYGIADGVFRVTMNILFMNTVDIPRKPSAFGQANMVVSLPNAAGPAVAGMMADKEGSYTSAFYMAGSATIAGGLIMFLHLCFFKEKPGHQSRFSDLTGPSSATNDETDHRMARTGPGSVLNEIDSPL